MFVEVFHSMIKGIHLAREVKTSFSNSTPATAPVHRNLDFPLTVIIDIIERERRRNLHIKKLQSKAWATMLSKIDPLWPSGQTSRHANASSDKDFQSLMQLSLSTFKQVLAMFK
jgi:hypothetical protein